MAKRYGRKRVQALLVSDEDATELRLGPEYQTEHCLMFSEVKFLLDRIKTQNEWSSASGAGGEEARHNLGPVFQKTLDYITATCTITNIETIKEMRKVLDRDATGLEPFEIAQLANLLPERADEAKAMVPSLHARKDDDELQALLNELQALKRFQS